jgi:hypothetical protein
MFCPESLRRVHTTRSLGIGLPRQLLDPPPAADPWRANPRPGVLVADDGRGLVRTATYFFAPVGMTSVPWRRITTLVVDRCTVATALAECWWKRRRRPLGMAHALYRSHERATSGPCASSLRTARLRSNVGALPQAALEVERAMSVQRGGPLLLRSSCSALDQKHYAATTLARRLDRPAWLRDQQRVGPR